MPWRIPSPIVVLSLSWSIAEKWKIKIYFLCQCFVETNYQTNATFFGFRSLIFLLAFLFLRLFHNFLFYDYYLSTREPAENCEPIWLTVIIVKIDCRDSKNKILCCHLDSTCFSRFLFHLSYIVNKTILPLLNGRFRWSNVNIIVKLTSFHLFENHSIRFWFHFNALTVCLWSSNISFNYKLILIVTERVWIERRSRLQHDGAHLFSVITLNKEFNEKKTQTKRNHRTQIEIMKRNHKK